MSEVWIHAQGQRRLCHGGPAIHFFYAGGSEVPRSLLTKYRSGGKVRYGDLDYQKLEEGYDAFVSFVRTQVEPKVALDPKYAPLKRFAAIHLWNENFLGIDKARSLTRKPYASMAPLSAAHRKQVGNDTDYIDEVYEFLRYRKDICHITGLSVLQITQLPFSEWGRLQKFILQLIKDDEARPEAEREAARKDAALPKTPKPQPRTGTPR